MSSPWVKLEDQTVNGEFPLLRFLAASKRSVVFLTQSARLGRSELALKLLPATPGLTQLQLARWRAFAALSHPHLVQIFEAGECQIGGRNFLYVVMDYADQNLAQLLERRALTEEETREMLMPVLDALAFLHEKKLVQGRLKPSNVLVVGDQIKLASDTIRAFSETSRTSTARSAYAPPEVSEGIRTAAGDVWALGVTLCEALTRQQPRGLFQGEMLLPPQMPAAFRGVVTRCLNRLAEGRPTVEELQAWSHGAPREDALSMSESNAATSDVVDSVGELPATASTRAVTQRRWLWLGLAVILGALLLFITSWAAIRG